MGVALQMLLDLTIALFLFGSWMRRDARRLGSATGYAIEVNYTPADPTGPWTAPKPGAGRRRVVKTPVPASQLLVRVAALDSHGTQTDWSDAILATTL